MAATTRMRTRADSKDHFIGFKIRERRIQLGLTQQQLAQLIGVTYQQAHKYERGVNRVSASRLHDIAETLHVPISYFFEGLDSQAAQATTARQRMCLELSRNFTNIANDRHQEAVSQLVRILANAGSSEPVQEKPAETPRTTVGTTLSATRRHAGVRTPRW